MTLNEFKAWLDGFEEALGGNPPNADQWKTIKGKLAKVVPLDAKLVTYRDAVRGPVWLKGTVDFNALAAADAERRRLNHQTVSA